MNAPLSPLEVFRAKGIPSRRMEDWKYTDLRGALDGVAVDQLPVATIGTIDPHFAEGLEVLGGLPAGTEDRGAGPMEAAARAFGGKPAIFRVPPGVRVKEPLKIAFTSAGHAHLVLFVEDGASLTLLESHEACDELLNISLAIRLGRGARLTHIRRTPFAAGQVVVETISAVLEADARYLVHLLDQGGKLARTEIHARLQGEGAACEFSGASVLNDGAHADITTHVEHAVGNTASRQLFKKVIAGHARGIYQGKITVAQGANGSDSVQTAKALLLGARAEADLKPELEIFADDVKCAHGAAIGDLDMESLFYLRSRGIPEEEARSLLIRAFLEEAVDAIEDETLREDAWRFVENGLEQLMQVRP